MQRHRFVLAAAVRRREVPDDAQARPPTQQDAEALAQLLHDAYRGSIDDEGETLDQQREVIAQLFAGEFGPVLWAVSEVTLRAGRIVAATLVTLWWGGPFVAFVVSAPEHRRAGLARAGLQRAMNRLAAGDETVLRLVVTQGNEPAQALYEALGFRPLAQLPLTTA